MKIFPVASIVALTTLSLPVTAHDYSFAEAGYVSVDRGRSDDSGLRVAGSLPVTASVNAFAEFLDTGSFSQAEIGAQWHQRIAQRLDLTASLSIANVDTGPDDDSGIGLRAGLRWQSPNGQFEVNPEIRSLAVFDDRVTTLRLSGLAALSPDFHAVGTLQGGDDDRIELGLRAGF